MTCPPAFYILLLSFPLLCFLPPCWSVCIDFEAMLMQKEARSKAPQGTRLHLPALTAAAAGGQHASFVQSTLTELRYYSYYNIHHFYFSKLPHKPMLAKPKCSGVHWPQSTTASIKAVLKATNTRKPFFQVNARINQLEQFQHYDQKQQHGMKNTQDISWNRNPQRAIICITCKLL